MLLGSEQDARTTTRIAPLFSILFTVSEAVGEQEGVVQIHRVRRGSQQAIAIFFFIPCNSVIAAILPDSRSGSQGFAVTLMFRFSGDIRWVIAAKKMELGLDFSEDFR